jgi:hypothetical protein
MVDCSYFSPVVHYLRCASPSSLRLYAAKRSCMALEYRSKAFDGL